MIPGGKSRIRSIGNKGICDGKLGVTGVDPKMGSKIFRADRRTRRHSLKSPNISVGIAERLVDVFVADIFYLAYDNILVYQ